MPQDVPLYGIIPARYASTRFPGKPLAELLGRPMFRHVYERACLARHPEHSSMPLFRSVTLATDDRRIARVAEEAGVPFVMTSPLHVSGTDRVREAADLLGVEEGAVVVNIQGDEPVLDPVMLEELITPFTDAAVRVSTLAAEIPLEQAMSPSRVKVVMAGSGDALYFSRALVPCAKAPDPAQHFLGHVGLYAFRREALEAFVALPPSRLELTEGLEQLRLLENGIPIRVVVTTRHSQGVDTPEDLEKVRALLMQEHFYRG